MLLTYLSLLIFSNLPSDAIFYLPQARLISTLMELDLMIMFRSICIEPMQISIGSVHILLLSVLGVGLGVGQCKWTTMVCLH